MFGKGENELILATYLFECTELLDRLEQIVLNCDNNFTDPEIINELFRIMHTVKGSSSMLEFSNIASTAHAMEDVMHQIRDGELNNIRGTKLSNLLLQCKDFIKNELDKVANGTNPDADNSEIMAEIRRFGATSENDMTPDMPESQRVAAEDILGQKYAIIENPPTDIHAPKIYYTRIFLEDDCQMEDLRAFAILESLKQIGRVVEHVPYDLNNNDNARLISKKGFQIIFETHLDYPQVLNFLEKKTVFLKSLDLYYVTKSDTQSRSAKEEAEKQGPVINKNSDLSRFISVNLSKLDKLINITSEIIITEALLVQNPDLAGLKLPNFKKVANRFRKITTELQDIVLSLRMVPIASTFQKMNRVVRDTAEKLEKKVDLVLVGEETEVDKNIIENLSDPMMHLVRNSVDHGIEATAARLRKGKPETGKVILEARNVGGEVWISIRDDGGGLNKEKIIAKAMAQGLISSKNETEISDAEIYSLIFRPGFSTKDVATEYSGRGVGMDVVSQNIARIHGSVAVDYSSPEGTSITMRIPLTLAIIGGLTVTVGNSKFTIPLESILEIYRLKSNNIIHDTDEKEIINIRNHFYPLLRLHERFAIKNGLTDLTNGMTLLVKSNENKFCIFVDRLLGEQQVVVKALPKYIRSIAGISGCTLLGDGSVSLILDVSKIAG